MTRLEILFLSEVIFCSRNPAAGHAPGKNGAELLGFGGFLFQLPTVTLIGFLSFGSEVKTLHVCWLASNQHFQKQ